MLHIFHSNRLETLASQFTEVVTSTGLDPFKAEQVIVQNAGMGRWLSMQLAEQSGIAANMKYLFPAEITWELLRKVLDNNNVPERDPCSPKLLRWRLLAELSGKTDKYQDDLGHYLSADNDDMAWQLAKQISTVFDGYLFFRPDWIQRWEKEPATDWQERLWQNVVVDQRLEHWIRLQYRFIKQLEHTDPEKLPKRISFFSVPALSPAYIELIAKVAEKIDVYFFVMNPSWQYWGDIESRKQKIKRDLETQEYVTVGNPLLASWGTQGRDFIENLRNLEPYPVETDDFTDPEPASMLEQLQADILNLEGEDAFGEIPLSPDDHSISIQSCHSPMREVEVLYDQLLAALEQDKTLTPADVVVMSPEIDGYAPFIEAVFSGAQVALPFSIADQRFSAAKNISTACVQMLNIPQSKFEAEVVFALLEYAEIREAFKLDETQIQQCREWVRAVNIRWGVDKTFREQFSKQSTFEHTWMYGLDRLLLGYAMPGDHLFSGVLPFNELEGSQAQVLERFQQFVFTLFPMAKWPTQQLPIADWCDRLRGLLTKLFPEDASTYKVLQAIDALQQSLLQADFTKPLAWSIFRDALRTQLEQNNQADGFLGSGITFCTLMPMRSVPFKFVALLGMQDGGFPRQDTRISFDKLAHDKHRRGDRSRRDEDRYLFLESLLSARQTLYISYVGQSALNNNTIMPSVLVSELLDYLEKRFTIDPDSFITRHPLQAFSQRYFNNSGLFSYRSDLATLHSGDMRQHNTLPFSNGQVLPEPDEHKRFVSLDELISFYRRPARHFLAQRFDLSLYEQADTLSEREPFALEAFSDSEIARQSLHHIEQEYQPAATEALLRAQGLLPHGKPGQLLFERCHEQTRQLAAQVPELSAPETFEFHLQARELELRGAIKNITTDGRHLLLFGYSGAWQWLEIWIHHLAMSCCTAIPADRIRQTCIYTADANYRLPPTENAEQQLAELLQGYWQGMQQALPFFPKSAWAMYQKGNPESANVETAINEWLGSDFHAGEQYKPEYALLCRDQSPFNDPQQAAEFMYWSDKVFGNLFRVREEI